MKPRFLMLAFIVALSCTVCAEETEVRLCEPWESEYTDEDATGDHVIALWEFKPGAEMEDASGHGHDLVLHAGSLHGPELLRARPRSAHLEAQGDPQRDRRGLRRQDHGVRRAPGGRTGAQGGPAGPDRHDAGGGLPRHRPRPMA